ncbi:MAG TPA: TonB-dependent receptor [Thermoanaerobaculia bacterium]|nr:TonB-dependent receptor [Thermoanaerobaculia bacterium]
MTSFRAKSFLTAVLLLALMITAVPAWAQSTTARIEGIVTDRSGAAVPGASVTATQVATNVSRTVVTDREGAYTITPLPVGDYRVVIELDGFRPSVTTVALTVNRVARIDAQLELGVAETLEVTAAAPIIDKTTSYIGTVIEAEQVEKLPLNGRNFTQLATLVPGVTRGIPGSNSSGGGSGTDAETFRYSEFGGAALSVNGLREQFNNYMIEGIDNNETLVNSIAYLPSPEAIREFGVITTSAPAEFGRAGGAVQNLAIKSGTNALDGSVFYFLRPKSLAARPEFAEEKPDFSNEDFGATLGGPLVRDRIFYFLSYHGLRNSIPIEAGNRVTVPTARMRNGDFSELLDPAVSGFGQTVIIYDPLTGDPFPGNIIPANRINPVGQAYLNVYPLPTHPGVTQNYLTRRQKRSTYDDIDAKVDLSLGPADQLFLSGSHWANPFSDPGRIPGYQAGFGAGTSENDGYTLRLGETHVFSGNLVNELRAGWTDFHFAFLPVGFGTDQNRELGIPGPGGITTANGISLIGGGNGFFIEYLGDFGQYRIQQQTVQLSDTVTWLQGNHTFKAGGTLMRRNMAQERTQFGKGFYFFRDGFGFQPGFSGYEVSDMLVGTTDFTATGVPGFVPRNAISWENSLFVQDDWRVTPDLTLNLGLRWDVYTPYYEENDRMANFDPVTQRLVVPGQGGVPRSTIDTDMDNFGPRIGFNYLLNERTSLRGGYGIFYSLDRGGIDSQLTENPPGATTEFRFGGDPGSRVRLSDPIPLPTPVDPLSPVLPLGSGIVYIPRDSETTEVQQWSLGAQREVTNRMSAMVAYVGTRAENLAARITSAGFAGDVADRLTTIMYIGSSSYDALQTSVRLREWRGLSFLASYTLGEARNDTPGLFPGNPSRGGTVTDAGCVRPGQVCNLTLDDGPADYDVRHRFTFASTWAIPFARENAILGGWALNTVLTLQTGTPFTAYSDFGGITRADQIGDPNTGPETVDRWFNTGAFRPATGSQGTAGRNSVRGPGTRTLDLSLFKTFDLARAGAVELRVEGFNVLNTPQYTQPNNVVADPNFGRITGTRQNTERQIQLAVRYLF